MCDALAVFSDNLVRSDARAFARLMAHLHEVDREYTVIMVQVENEVGLLGDSRDRSGAANAVFEAPVPTDLVEALRKDWDVLRPSLRERLGEFYESPPPATATWEQAFGKSTATDELFMAYHFAKYVEQVASAGKNEHLVPLYANAWLHSPPDPIANIPESDDAQHGAGGAGIGAGSDSKVTNAKPNPVGGGSEPGVYPSGGPVPGMLDIWQVFAPSLSFLSPDIYTADYLDTCRSYSHRGQTLFIPEQRRDEYGALRIWAAIGTYGAIGCSPFGIDTIDPTATPFTEHYQLLKEVAPLILSARTSGLETYGFWFDRFEAGESDPSPTHTVRMGEWQLVIERAHVFGHPSPGYGMVIQQESDRFLLIGEGFQVNFKSTSPDSVFTGILSFEEKEVDPANPESGGLRTLRLMNGDETRAGKHVVMPSRDPDYGDFFICITIPARTRIAECSVYSLTE